jgi:FkbM family methyltransferase
MIKELLKNFIPLPIWDYLRYWKFRVFKRGRFASHGLDIKLEKYLNYDNGFFVELGANDGYTGSNTLYLEIFKGWRGVLIEPSPHLFLSCTHFRNRKGNKIFCNACVPMDYDEKYVDIEYANLMSISSNLELDIDDQDAFLKIGREHLQPNQRNLRFGALARTLSSILEEGNAPKEIDFLSLDVEGAELSVLRGVNFNDYSFKYMLIECRDIEILESYLLEKGYRKIDKLNYRDYLFSKI